MAIDADAVQTQRPDGCSCRLEERYYCPALQLKKEISLNVETGGDQFDAFLFKSVGQGVDQKQEILCEVTEGTNNGAKEEGASWFISGKEGAR